MNYILLIILINTNLLPILQPLRDVALIRYVQNRYIWLPLSRLTPPTVTEEFAWVDLRKIFRGCQRMA